jgi:DNA repair protein SbcC/Rad50
VLMRPEAQMEAQRNAILALKKACDQAMVALAEQEKGAQAHRAHAPKEEDRAFWAQQATQAKMEEEEAMADVQSTRLQLEDDTQRRTAALALQDQMQKQADETRRWSQLNALIGSADGRKFRHHAQQLTMDILLIHANSHMQGLNRRYRLERIPDKLALQVIDQDMGEEVRSVYSLSGGESFLVSLALALGLASLSAERTRIESLFIDEGFGSLDSDTLQVAMGALDALQAQGRKVGVITHVQEMTERIEVKIALTRGKNGRSEVHLHAQA